MTKGTAVFVSVGARKMLATARHVVRSRKLRRHPLLLMLPRLGPDGLAMIGEQTVPVTVHLELEISRKLFHRRKGEPETLGGFSGGPIAVVGSDGKFLLGIIKQGRDVFASLRVAASLGAGPRKSLA